MQRHHVSRSRIQRVHEEQFPRNISLTQCDYASAPKPYQTELDPLLESHISGLVEAWQGICRPTTPRAHSQIVVGTCRPGVTTSMQITAEKNTLVQVHMPHASCVDIGWRSPSEQLSCGTMVGNVRKQFHAV